MRVFEVAKELSVPAESLVHLLREMDIPVRSHMTALADEHVARLRTVIERERRLGHKDVGEALEAAIGDVAGAPKRRRRKREETEGGTPENAPDSTADPVADAAEAIMAEAAEAAAERGAGLVTTGGALPTGITVVVDSSVVPPAEPGETLEAAPGAAAPVDETVANAPASPPQPAAEDVPPRPAAPTPARPASQRTLRPDARPEGAPRQDSNRPPREPLRPAASSGPAAPPRPTPPR